MYTFSTCLRSVSLSKPPSFHTKGMHKWFDFVFYAADSLRPTKTRKNCISWNEFRFFLRQARSRRNLFDAKESTRLGQDILIPGPSSLGANKKPWRDGELTPCNTTIGTQTGRCWYANICKHDGTEWWIPSSKTNMAMENGPGLKMYFLLKMGIFQPAMLVYQLLDSECCQFRRCFDHALVRGPDYGRLSEWIRVTCVKTIHKRNPLVSRFWTFLTQFLKSTKIFSRIFQMSRDLIRRCTHSLLDSIISSPCFFYCDA